VNNQQINQLQKVLKEFKDVYPEMNANMMLVLLEVAKGEGVTGSDIVDRHDMPQAIASRALRCLDAGKDPLKRWDLCDLRFDPEDLRNRLRFPNAKMKNFIARLSVAMN
jgi:DNA-binding MarR family transcriptional regulator